MTPVDGEVSGRAPRVFVSHCERNMGPTEFACRIITLLGCEAVLAEAQPKFAAPVRGVVHGSMDSCDAALVVLTPDDLVEGTAQPSQSVVVEVGNLQRDPKLKARYFVVLQADVRTGPMIPETHYRFGEGGFGPIAVAVLTELDAIGLFLNHYRVPGSDFDLARIGAMAHHARGLIRAGGLQPENVRDLVEKMGESFKEAMRKYIESP